MKAKFLDYYQRNEALVSILVFVAGFLFDLLTLGRIDDLLNLIQQAVYLVILGTLLIIEIKLKTNTMTLSPRGEKFWKYHDLVVHFLFGSLLSAYTIFYYTSASAITSFFFIVLLAGLMLANELPKVQKLGLMVRVVLFSICVMSYFAFFYPILMGHVGWVPFWLGFLSSAGILALVWKLNFQGQMSRSDFLTKNVVYPAVIIHLLFLFGYYTSLIPPVPVAVKKIGVYYEVTKSDGHYYGTHLKKWWKFWPGAEKFQTRPGDKIIVLMAIFSPAAFKDSIKLRWYHDGRDGWTLHDTIPMAILGGRDEGFRGYGTKQFFAPGDWRVVVETSDGREVGRISFDVETDESTEERIFKTDVF